MLSLTPDHMIAAGCYIEREWGYGYRVSEIESPTPVVSLFHVGARDGARFIIAVDKWGNCKLVDPAEGWRTLVQEMDREALRP